MNHRICRREIKADAAGFKADQENRDFARLKTPHRYFAIYGITRENDIVKTRSLQLHFNQGEHAGELRKQQNAPPLIDLFRQHGHQEIELGTLLGALRRSCLNQPWVAAHLPELEQSVKNDDLATTKTLCGHFFTHQRIHRHANGLIEITLPAGKFDLSDDNRFRRQLARHFFLLAPQDKGTNPTSQQITTLPVPLLLDRRAPVAGERLSISEKAGQKKIELAP